MIEDVLQDTSFIPSANGFHTFTIRLKDSQGNWGQVFQNIREDDILNFNATGKMNIYSSEGRLVLSKDNADGSKGINVSSLIKGNYILTI
ncbi:T9SS type A sorting domain-containing protein [Chryseobacterium sp.]|uniref:T9SS type A sorting domain-containing protein n=1 Tax=Chryseobacterium sp. TaxID=1871047 RepID=UPI002629A5F7|nr:T9SS type A sorting domain-containing protein [Chryseobacterium sp.]